MNRRLLFPVLLLPNRHHPAHVSQIAADLILVLHQIHGEDKEAEGNGSADPSVSLSGCLPS